MHTLIGIHAAMESTRKPFPNRRDKMQPDCHGSGISNWIHDGNFKNNLKFVISEHFRANDIKKIIEQMELYFPNVDRNDFDVFVPLNLPGPSDKVLDYGNVSIVTLVQKLSPQKESFKK